MVYEIKDGIKRKHRSFGRVSLEAGKDYNDIEISKYYYKYVDELNDSVTEAYDTINITGLILINLAFSYLGFNKESFSYHYFRLYLKQSLEGIPHYGRCNEVYSSRRIYEKEYSKDFQSILKNRKAILSKFNDRYYSDDINPLSSIDTYFEYYRPNNDLDALRTTITLDQNKNLYNVEIEGFKDIKAKELIKMPDTLLANVSDHARKDYFSSPKIEWKISCHIYELYDRYSYYNNIFENLEEINTNIMMKNIMGKIVYLIYLKIFNRKISIKNIKKFINGVDIYYWYSLYHNTVYKEKYFIKITNYLGLPILQQRFLTRKEILEILKLKEIKLKDGRTIKLLMPLCEI